jgi:hypothetical protein
MLVLLLFSLLARLPAHAEPLEEAVSFFEWLESHAREFAACEPRLDQGDYILCDNTRVPKAELEHLFALPAAKLEEELKAKGLQVELVCAGDGTKALLEGSCQKDSTNKMFAEISSLHGKYLPEEKRILIRNSASPGSLIHEFVHSLQSSNENSIYGQVYKKKRNRIQGALNRLMDSDLKAVQELEKNGRQAEAKPKMQEFLVASDAMRGFAPWQDLIDERSIFLLYLKFGKSFGATDADLALARKNLGFICGNPKLKELLPKTQCTL